MKLRIAAKVVNTVFHHRYKDFERHVRVRYRRGTIQKALAVCRKKWLNPRVPYVPPDSELDEQAEVLGLILFDMAEKVFGVDPAECDKKKEEFLQEMARAKEEG